MPASAAAATSTTPPPSRQEHSHNSPSFTPAEEGEEEEERKAGCPAASSEADPPRHLEPPAEDDASTAKPPSAATAAAAMVSSSSAQAPSSLIRHSREAFGDCALVEIIHLHDCLRGALKALESDVEDLAGTIARGADAGGGKSDGLSAEEQGEDEGTAAAGGGGEKSGQALPRHHSNEVLELERRVASRFKVIWSVFRSHSAAEDEFIWPALSKKTAGRIGGDGGHSSPAGDLAGTVDSVGEVGSAIDDSDRGSYESQQRREDEEEVAAAANVIVQEEYEEDHADEERMFAETDALLTQLREALVAHYNSPQSACDEGDDRSNCQPYDAVRGRSLAVISRDLSCKVGRLSQHLHEHLEKEETQCLPLVVNHLSGPEIHELVGNIMGKRSADTIANIMTMAVQNLEEEDRRDMIKYMKQSMTGTFFDRWLQMSGWMSACDEASERGHGGDNDDDDGGDGKKRAAEASAGSEEVVSGDDAPRGKRSRDESAPPDDVVSSQTAPNWSTATATGNDAASAYSARPLETTSQAELEKLIRAVASNPALTPAQKNTTIQGLRDSVWKLNLRQKQQQLERATVVNEVVPQFPAFLAQAAERVSPSLVSARTRKVRVTPPSNHYRRTRHGKVELVWNSDSPTSRLPDSGTVPLFSAAELAPTYHDGAAGAVLGCAHYARACKLRHPRSGRLYTCRLCCQQQRELPTSDDDEPLDRYEVTEVMCMKCNTLQPAEDRCVNPDCESGGKPFARYFCRICHLYDDGSRPIFHCPYCNICKVGVGLGQDFRHCMRCNACISLPEYTDHHCIPQKLQGDCPICHESLFQSTEPLRGLRCGHVMHLSCFTSYRRGHSYTCPLCMRSMEDMSDYFSILDAAVRMQPMPPAYLSTLSNIYCQDCGKTGQVAYHFVGQKCPHCGSYNTREMGRVNNSPS